MRVLLLLMLACLLCSCRPSFTDARLTNADFVGTWRVSPGSFNIGHMSDSFSAFALKLNADGSFVAESVPEHFFFYEWPAQKEIHGKWKLEYNSRDQLYDFSLDFDAINGHGAGWGGEILYWRDRDGDHSFIPPQDLLIRMNIEPKPGSGDISGNLQFGLIRQK